MPAARAALARFEDRLPEPVLYDAALCLSELVTNAIQHPAPESGDELELRLELRQDALRVRVIDPGGGFEPGPPTQGSERGWGLYIVDQLSTSWGTDPGELTTIWFEIARDQPGAVAEGDSWTADPADSRERRGDELAHAVARVRPRLAIQ